MKDDFIKPETINQELFLDSNKVIISKTDKFGIFEFANDYFMEISGYEEYELMGKSMYCVQHPDMPEVIFKHLWEKLLAKEPTSVIVKNLTKSGKFYWSLTSFTYKLDKTTGEITSIFSRRTTPTRESIAFFTKIYKTLSTIEEKNSLAAAEKYIIGFLEDKQTNFNGLVQSFYKNDNTNPSTNQSIQKKVEKPVTTQKTAVKTTLITKPSKKEKEVNTTPENNTIQNSNGSKKSLFQKLFGKTEEELEAERKRKK